MKTFLFSISVYSYHVEVEPLVAYLRAQGYHIVVYLGWLDACLEDVKAHYEAMGCQVIVADESVAYVETGALKTNGNQAQTEEKRGAFKGLMAQIRHQISHIKLLRSFLRLMRLSRLKEPMAKAFQFATRLLNDIQPDAVFLGPFHSIGKVDNALYNQSVRRNIPRYCYSYTPYGGRLNTALSKFNRRRLGNLPVDYEVKFDLLNRLIATLKPEWLLGEKGNQFFSFEPLAIHASNITGTGLDDVNARPQCNYTRYFLFSEHSRKMHDDPGFPIERAHVVGMPRLDRVVDYFRQERNIREFYTYLGLDYGEPYILYNVEPLMEHKTLPPKQHWQYFNKMMEIAHATGRKVVLSLHPLCDPENYKFAEEKYGVKLSLDYSIYYLYVFCQFVISFRCSTNMLSQILHKKVIMYDLIHLTSMGNKEAIEQYVLPNMEISSDFDELMQLIHAAVNTVSDFNNFDEVMLKYKPAVQQIEEWVNLDVIK